MTDRTLDYIPRLVDTNLPYRMGAAGDTNTSRYWTPGVVLDQGNEGACVGFGCTAEYLASPVRGSLLKYIKPADKSDAGSFLAGQVYREAKEVDEWEGVDYDGTSVRAGMLVGRERGWWEGFRWALNMGELRAALDLGPVVIGVEWRERMYEPLGRDLIVAGDVVGGHCLLITGYQASTKSYRLRNSWGASWGVNGTAYITDTDLDQILFKAGGEAAVPVGRKA